MYIISVCRLADAEPVGATAARSSTMIRAGPKSSRVGLLSVGYLRMTS